MRVDKKSDPMLGGTATPTAWKLSHTSATIDMISAEAYFTRQWNCHMSGLRKFVCMPGHRKPWTF